MTSSFWKCFFSLYLEPDTACQVIARILAELPKLLVPADLNSLWLYPTQASES